MWKTNLEVNLPKGYKVKENEDVFFLVKGDTEEVLGIFGKFNNPAPDIARYAIEDLNKSSVFFFERLFFKAFPFESLL